MPVSQTVEAYTPAVWRVASRREETADTVTFTLTPPEGAPPLAFAPGQFNMLYTFGAGEVPISISGDPSRAKEGTTHTLRAVGSVTRLPLTVVPDAGNPYIFGLVGQPWQRECRVQYLVLLPRLQARCRGRLH